MTRIISTGVVLLIAAWGALGAECEEPTTVYLPVDTVDEHLGLRGETRAQYLARSYGGESWELDRPGTIEVTAPQEPGETPIHVGLRDPQAYGKIDIDIVVESKLDYLDERERPAIIYGHRLIGRYEIEPGATPTIRVPQGVIKEPGALLVLARLVPVAGGEVERRLHEFAVGVAGCERRIYVRDRFTALRLNRATRGKSKNSSP